MVEMIEDMDSLDDKLFGNAFKRNSSAENSKRRITFAGSHNNLILLNMCNFVYHLREIHINIFNKIYFFFIFIDYIYLLIFTL